jgi:predicted dehydrogenase
MLSIPLLLLSVGFISCEKPLTEDSSKVLQAYPSLLRKSNSPIDCSHQLNQLLHDLGEDGRSKVMVGFVRRFNEQYHTALRSIQAGSIRVPLIIRSQGAEKLDKSGFFIEHARHRGCIFVDTVIHDIDLTPSFFGRRIAVEVVVGVAGDEVSDRIAGEFGNWKKD